jgi:type VI protein secretion system component VasK
VGVRIRWFIIVALGLVGFVWIGQGTGLIRGSSFMSDDIRWAAIGVVLIVCAVVFAVIEYRRRPKV